MTKGDDSRRSARIPIRALVIPVLVGTMALAGIATATAATRTHAATQTVLTGLKGKRGTQLVVEMKGQKLTLYNFSKDQGTSTCYGKCAKVWYPLIDHGKIVATKGSQINTKQLKTIKRKDGSVQIAYYGQPLYRYHTDTKTGQMAGADKFQFGGSWGVMGIQGSTLSSGHY